MVRVEIHLLRANHSFLPLSSSQSESSQKGEGAAAQEHEEEKEGRWMRETEKSLETAGRNPLQEHAAEAAEVAAAGA